MQALRTRPAVQRGGVLLVPIEDIIPSPVQPRQRFEEEALRELSESIRSYGILNPLNVRLRGGKYELVAGERRLRAAKLAGLSQVPCILLDVNMEDAGLIALIENLQRKDLDFVEEAEGLRRLIRMFGLRQEEAARRIGKSQSAVANKLRLLRLSQEERDIITDTGLSERHARALLKIDDEDMRKSVLLKAVNGGWTVNQLEGQIKKMQEQEIRRQNIRKGAVVLRDVRMFFNTVNKAVDVMRLAGVEADTKRIDHEDHIEYIIKISSKNLKNTPISVP